MRSTRFVLALLSVLPAAGAIKSQAPPTKVTLTAGVLQGSAQGKIAIFEGIPYAKPPVGPLRWREPQPAAPWTSPRDATKPGNPCMQNAAGTDGFVAGLAATYGVTYTPRTQEVSEDCLYLNVWTAGARAKTKLPVMVWVHGGSNRTGSGTEESYNGASLATHGIVVVTINYRLGVFGFMAHPELDAESPHNSSGNYALLDQMAALRWVQQNIAAFGGDPGNVTVAGESAGGVDITTLMTSPLAAGLFRRAIAESGTAFGYVPFREKSKQEDIGLAIGKEAAGGKAAGQLQALRQLSADQLTTLTAQVLAAQFKGADVTGPIVDGWVLTLAPQKAFATGAIQKVDLLAGVNAREWSVFRLAAAAAAAKKSDQPAAGPGAQLQMVRTVAGPLYGDQITDVVQHYLPEMQTDRVLAIDHAFNDLLAACPTGAEASLVTSGGKHAFVYLFARSIPGPGQSTLGAFHSIEVPYLFNTFDTHQWSWLPVTPADRKLSTQVEEYWTNFVKTGDPNGTGLPRWNTWDATTQPFVRFSEAAEPVPAEHFGPYDCNLSPDHLKTELAK